MKEEEGAVQFSACFFLSCLGIREVNHANQLQVRSTFFYRNLEAPYHDGKLNCSHRKKRRRNSGGFSRESSQTPGD